MNTIYERAASIKRRLAALPVEPDGSMLIPEELMRDMEELARDDEATDILAMFARMRAEGRAR